MNNREKILLLLHKIFRNDKITNEIAKSTGYKIDNIEIQIPDIENQFFLDTATWGLNIFEKELALENVSSKTYDDRRSLISAKWRGTGKLTLELIKQTVDAFTNGIVEVTFTGTINIEFVSEIGKPPNMNDVYKAIEEIKPAHLSINYTFKYRTYDEARAYTYWELQAVTWNELRETSTTVVENKIIDRYYNDVINKGYTCNKNSTERKVIRDKFYNDVLNKLMDNGYDQDGNKLI